MPLFLFGTYEGHQELGAGEGRNPHGTGSVTNLGAGGAVGLTDPYGNRGECAGSGCGVVQRNGPGGGTFCHGERCWTSNTRGHVQDSTGAGGGAYLLNPAADGRNSGRGCQPGTGGECTGGGSTNLGWYGDNRDGSLNLITDKDVAEFLERKPDYLIPNDFPTTLAAVNRGVSVADVAPRSALARAYNDLAQALHGWFGARAPSAAETSTGALARVRGMFRRS